MVEEAISMFVETTGTRLVAIRKAVAHEDAASLAREAHTLKGEAAMLGAQELAELARQLEQFGKAGDVAQAAARLDDLERTFERARAALQAA
jgi:HPt (histidine-containing phosphotransfer) domain-containing protein